VPQSPTLFNGTVRENLIGGNRNSDEPDEFLLSVLKTCRLDVLAERGLDGTVGTLSDGQKQLFCVARALVRRCGNVFARHFMLKDEHMPRQAQDKHRENSPKEETFLQAEDSSA